MLNFSANRFNINLILKIKTIIKNKLIIKIFHVDKYQKSKKDVSVNIFYVKCFKSFC